MRPASEHLHPRDPAPPAAGAAARPRAARSVRTSRVREGSPRPGRGARAAATQPDHAGDASGPTSSRLLHDAGGSLETDVVMERLAERLEDVLLERDRTGSGGEVRWQTSARKARKAMIDEGLILPARPGRLAAHRARRRAGLTQLLTAAADRHVHAGSRRRAGPRAAGSGRRRTRTCRGRRSSSGRAASSSPIAAYVAATTSAQ